ncbi:hypothetical protein CEXT_647121 [Caerostris extrusa]|uniref:Uncharacterized protein n=1 Tax=Caerostris extrusa TaxID=172846 RepID=A0AAV4R8H0_CAEEX|nr:hypothetical protein CEXT_647121 [Caerostris extrusa]
MSVPKSFGRLNASAHSLAISTKPGNARSLDVAFTACRGIYSCSVASQPDFRLVVINGSGIRERTREREGCSISCREGVEGRGRRGTEEDNPLDPKGILREVPFNTVNLRESESNFLHQLKD